MTTSEMKNQFYQIADTVGKTWDIDVAMQIVDTIGMRCSPDGYDRILANKVRQLLPRLETAEYIEWANGIIATAEANESNGHDLRGFKKNVHHTG